MWLLHFFSDGFIEFIVHTVLILGILGTVLTFVLLNRLLLLMPFLAPYYQALRAASVIFLVSGIYLEGGYSTEMAWRKRVREMEARVAAAEAQSLAANAQLEKKSQEKMQVIQGRQVIVKQYIDREVKKYDGQCVIPEAFVKAHNDSAEAPKK